MTVLGDKKTKSSHAFQTASLSFYAPVHNDLGMHRCISSPIVDGINIGAIETPMRSRFVSIQNVAPQDRHAPVHRTPGADGFSVMHRCMFSRSGAHARYAPVHKTSPSPASTRTRPPVCTGAYRRLRRAVAPKRKGPLSGPFLFGGSQIGGLS